MILPGKPDEIVWGQGNWVFLDIGFARDKKTCGLLFGDGQPSCVKFSDAVSRIITLALAPGSPLNLVIEAPLSVAFTEEGNPSGRALEKNGSQTRYWYNGLGCAVMVAAMYLIRQLHDANLDQTLRLFEGFVSYKDKSKGTDHCQDVEFLRQVVLSPQKYSSCIIHPDALKMAPTDRLQSAFCVAGIDCGVPAVIQHILPEKMKTSSEPGGKRWVEERSRRVLLHGGFFRYGLPRISEHLVSAA